MFNLCVMLVCVYVMYLFRDLCTILCVVVMY